MRRDKFRAMLHRHLPVFEFVSGYDTQTFFCDLIAGITVGLTVMPQALAYATLAGVEPQFGLYSAFAGCFVYMFFGSCKEITIGPTALMALMTYQQVINRNSDYAVLLCFLSGVMQLLMAILNLGVLVDFISIPVTVGFTSATSVIIISSQFKYIFGLNFKSNGFFDTLCKVYANISQLRYADFQMAVVCIVLLLALRKIKDIKLRRKSLEKTIWMISTSRNALIVIGSSVLAFYYEYSTGSSPFMLTGKVKPGLPSIGPPPFSTTMNNRTVEFTEMLADLGSSVVMVPIIAVLGNVAIAKAFAHGKSVDATQELIALSFCNVIGSFFSSIPITGSFSRSAVNHASGVKTPLGGLYTGVLVLLSLSFLTPAFKYIPKAALGAVIICAVIFMIEYEVVRPMWKSNRKDLIPMIATFVLCLSVGVELGIVIGVVINIMLLLYPSARPRINVEKLMTSNGLEYLLITPNNSLYFPAVEFIKSHVGNAGLSSIHLPVVIDCRFILGADFTAAKGIAAMIKDFSKRKQSLYFLNPSEDVINVFKGAGIDFNSIQSTQELEDCVFDSEESKLLKQIDTGFNELEEVKSPECHQRLNGTNTS